MNKIEQVNQGSRRLSVVTANAEFGRFIREGGVEQFAETDVLLMQEVDEDRDNLSEILSESGLEIAIASRGLGLAIAVSRRLNVVSTNVTMILRQGFMKEFIANASGGDSKLATRLRSRGLLTAEVELDGRQISVATSHPPVPILLNRRKEHVRGLSRELTTIKGPLIFGADMNHWPEPRLVDATMQHLTGLERVDIGSEPTFHIRKSASQFFELIGHPRIFDGQLDSLYYRGVGIVDASSEVVDIPSDHSAVYAEFNINE
jgi:endonuclease/exonuclease/phosphatase family metal-dependent hydrolase